MMFVICTSQGEKIRSMLNFCATFGITITSSKNYLSFLKTLTCLNVVIVSYAKKHEEAVAVGNLLSLRRVIHQFSLGMSILCRLQQMGDCEKGSVEKLTKVAFLHCIKGTLQVV